VAFTYRPGSRTTLNRIRVRIGDTDQFASADLRLEDEEITDLVLTEGGFIRREAAVEPGPTRGCRRDDPPRPRLRRARVPQLVGQSVDHRRDPGRPRIPRGREADQQQRRPQRLPGIWLIPALGGVARQLISFGSNPTWSPDGSLIAFQSQPWVGSGENTSAAGEGSTLWLVPSADGEPRPLTSIEEVGPGGQGSPAWSPDGRLISFVLGMRAFTVRRDGSVCPSHSTRAS
jgi:hypothetical protein